MINEVSFVLNLPFVVVRLHIASMCRRVVHRLVVDYGGVQIVDEAGHVGRRVDEVECQGRMTSACSYNVFALMKRSEITRINPALQYVHLGV